MADKKDLPSDNPFNFGSNPDVTKTPLPDDSDDSILDFGLVASVRDGASGRLNVETLPDPQSSPSLVSWTDVIRQQRETIAGGSSFGEPVKIDSVSDKDLLKRIVAEELQRSQSKDRDTDKLSQVPLIADDARSGSSVQLGQDRMAIPPQPASGSAVQFDMRRFPVDAADAMPMPWISDSGVMEAISLDDIDIDDMPMAEALSLDGDSQSADSGGSVARFIQEQDEDALLDLPFALDSGASGEHSSVLDFLIQEGGSGKSRPASDIVDLAASPGSGVLSGLSSRKRLESLDDKFIVPDVQPSSVEPGNSWMRDALKHAHDAWAIDETVTDATVPLTQMPKIEDTWTSEDVVEPTAPVAEAAGDSWARAAVPAEEVIDLAMEQPAQELASWDNAAPLPDSIVELNDDYAPAYHNPESELAIGVDGRVEPVAGGSWIHAAAAGEPLALDGEPIAIDLDEMMNADAAPAPATPAPIDVDGAWAVMEADEVVEEALPIDIDAAWDAIADDKDIESFDKISAKIDETSPSRSAWGSGDSSINKRTMASFQLPAENPEDAVDLYSEGPFNRGISDSGTLQISDEEMAEAARKQAVSDSSAIDLSSKHTSMFDLDMSSAVSGKAVTGEDMVDMSLPPGSEEDSSMIRRFEDVAREDPLFNMARPVAESEEETSEFLVAEAVADDEVSFPVTPPPGAKKGRKAPVPAADELVETNLYGMPEFSPPMPAQTRGKRKPAARTPTTEPVAEAAVAMPARASRSEQPRRKRGGLLIGTTLGLLVGAGGLFAAMYFDALPDPKTLLGEVAETPKKDVASRPTPNVTPDQPTPVTAVAARQLLETGNPAQAVAAFAKLDQEQVDVLAGLGQAQWLAYLQKSAAEGKSPDRESPETKAALDHLKNATEKAKGDEKAELDAARAFLWQGLIAESFEDDAAAELIYAQAEMELKSPTALAPIRAAGNRMKVTRPQSAPVTALPIEHLLLAFTLLAADPEGTPKADEPAGQEAGYLFWEALLLASKNQYADAARKIPLIKAVHARQQVKMAGRGLNPLSDPREQLTPTTLDELARLWGLYDQLYKRPESKMLVEQRKFVEALAAVFAKSKDNDDALKLAADKLMLKGDEKLVEAIQTLLTAKTKAEDDKKLADDGKKVADDMLAALGKSLKDAGIDDPKLEEGLKKVITGKADAETKVKEVATLLDKAGIKEPDTAKALALVITSRDDAEAVVKALRERFEKAKYIEADASKEMVFKAVDDAIARGAADALTRLAAEKKDAEAKAAKLEADADKVKKDAEAAVKKANEEAATAAKKANDDAAATVKKVEQQSADQKAMYEDRLANSAKDFVQQANKAELSLKAGNYDAALKDFTTGVKSLKVLPKDQEDLFDRIITTHPVLSRATSGVGDASRALKHYGDGLEFFRDGLFEKAEQQFGEAVRYDNRDARYRYFLGMSRYEQGRTGPAIEDMKAGAALEALGRPTSRAINTSLQTIQGPTRAVLEKYRP